MSLWVASLAKKSALFECQSCGYQSGKWMGKCPSCGGWESFIELTKEQAQIAKSSAMASVHGSKAIAITEVKDEAINRIPTLDDEFDIALGGGVVEGSLVLVGGAPGVGKSTLLLKTAGNLAKSGQKTLYVTGEESAGQVKSRSMRLDAQSDKLYLLNEINLDDIMAEMRGGEYRFVVIDSIQTMYSPAVPSAPGSVTQVREITFALMRYAKESGVPIFIIGHITKEGAIAGPRVLEHMVDTVLYFDGEPSGELRILRCFKNRFGSTSEIGIFEMSERGLVSAKNIGKKFFSKHAQNSGSAITVLMEGSRPIVVETQALVADSPYPSPKRSANGFDSTRLTMLIALLERKLGIALSRYDVYINIVGGMKIAEPSADLAVIAAIISSFKNRPIKTETVFLGEVSLIGDIREVGMIESRLKEALAQGFTKAIVPRVPKNMSTNIKCFEIDEVEKLLEWM